MMSGAETRGDGGEATRERMLTHAEARMEDRQYWSGKTPEERLQAMWELNRRMAAWRGVDLDEPKTIWTICRVPHRRG
jgi:hypothetical protein